MSTTTVSVHSTASDVSMEDLRRRESEAREAIRRRIGAATQAIAIQDADFSAAVGRLDEAAACLPDFVKKAPRLPAIPDGASGDPAKLEEHARNLKQFIGGFSRELDIAIAEAERLLQRRKMLAATWLAIADVEEQIRFHIQASEIAANRLHVSVQTIAPHRPGQDAELEEAQAGLVALRAALEKAEAERSSLEARVATLERASSLAGHTVSSRGAASAQASFEAAKRENAQAVAKSGIAKILGKVGLQATDLPRAVQLQLEHAITQAHVLDSQVHVTHLIIREAGRLDGIKRSSQMMLTPPEIVAQEDIHLTQRWETLLDQLQRVASGQEEFSPSIDLEYNQLCADARRQIANAFIKIDWIKAVTDQGLEVIVRDNGQDMVLVDLDHPEAWVEVTEGETDDGRGLIMEIKADASTSAYNDSEVTEILCSKLEAVAKGTSDKVLSVSEVVERKDRITRGKRPKMGHTAKVRGF